jgi:hypothetical protein
MKTYALAAALPFALALAACGDSTGEVDGTDTTSMQPEAVEPMSQGMTEPMATETPMADDAMSEDGMMADPMMETPVPDATETPM